MPVWNRASQPPLHVTPGLGRRPAHCRVLSSILDLPRRDARSSLLPSCDNHSPSSAERARCPLGDPAPPPVETHRAQLRSTDGRTEGWGRAHSALQNPLPEPAPLVQEKQAAPPDKEAPETQGKGIKVEPGWGETKDAEDSGDEEPAGHPAPPRREFTSVIRTGALKQDLVRPWGLVSPGDPPPSLLHAGFLPPVMRGLCTPSTIRYGPTELGLMYPHLQRLGPGPAFPEAFYPPLGLPYPGPTGTRLQRKGD